MHYRPSLNEFTQLARQASVVPVYRQLLGDSLTPVSAFDTVQEGDWSFLFESVVGGERLGRYSFLGAGPFLIFEAYGPKVHITRLGENGNIEETEASEHADPLRLLEEMLTKYHAPHVPGLPRFCGGAVGYAGYDSVRYVESLPNPPPDDRHLPDLSFAFYDRMVIFDHLNKTIAVVAHAHVDDADPARSYREACARVDRLVERLQQRGVQLPLTDIVPIAAVTRPYTSNFDPAAFENAVERCKEYIRAGDIFQVVLSQRLQTATHARPFDIYRTLRVVNPESVHVLREVGVVVPGGSVAGDHGAAWRGTR